MLFGSEYVRRIFACLTTFYFRDYTWKMGACRKGSLKRGESRRSASGCCKTSFEGRQVRFSTVTPGMTRCPVGSNSGEPPYYVSCNHQELDLFTVSTTSCITCIYLYMYNIAPATASRSSDTNPTRCHKFFQHSYWHVLTLHDSLFNNLKVEVRKTNTLHVILLGIGTRGRHVPWRASSKSWRWVSRPTYGT